MYHTIFVYTIIISYDIDFSGYQDERASQGRDDSLESSNHRFRRAGGGEFGDPKYRNWTARVVALAAGGRPKRQADLLASLPGRPDGQPGRPARRPARGRASRHIQPFPFAAPNLTPPPEKGCLREYQTFVRAEGDFGSKLSAGGRIRFRAVRETRCVAYVHAQALATTSPTILEQSLCCATRRAGPRDKACARGKEATHLRPLFRSALARPSL